MVVIEIVREVQSQQNDILPLLKVFVILTTLYTYTIIRLSLIVSRTVYRSGSRYRRE